MKPAAYDYQRPETVDAAVELLAKARGTAKVVAGGQSLGPMLNMRLVHTECLIDISRIPALSEVSETQDEIIIGACVTHAALEDGRVPDATNGMLASIARGIAYRAVRNRGTIGGSLAHADPAADWVTALTAIGATVAIAGPDGFRRVALDDFMQSAFETVLGADEILAAVHIPKLSADARWGFYKFCRKTGEFADAMSAVVVDPARSWVRAVIGATDSRPVIITDASQLIDNPNEIDDVIIESGLSADAYDMAVHRSALWRAVQNVVPA